MLCLSIVLVAEAAGQAGLDWPTNLEPVVAQARKENRPLLIWATRSTRDNDYDSDRADRRYAAQKKALQDPEVIAAARPFLTCRMDVVRYRDEAQKLGVHAFQIVTAMPDGEKLREISTGEAKEAAAIAVSLREAYSDFGARLYPKEAQPALTDAKTAPQKTRDALQFVARFRVSAADKDVIGLLDRPKLDASVHQSALRTLAALSTDPSVEALFEAAKKDRKAEPILAECDKSAAAVLLEHLESRDAGEQRIAYVALVKLFKIPDVKGESFWETAPQELRDREAARVRDRISENAKARKDPGSESRRKPNK
jgi:hypothetical protein